MLLAVGVILLAGASFRLRRWSDRRPDGDWRPATCTILRSTLRFPEAEYMPASKNRSSDKGQFKVEVEYVFDVDGREQWGGDEFCSLPGHCTSDEDVDAARAIRPGARLACFYRADAPEHSALRIVSPTTARNSRADIVAQGAAGLGLIGFGIGLLVWRRKRMRSPDRIPAARLVREAEPSEPT